MQWKKAIGGYVVKYAADGFFEVVMYIHVGRVHDHAEPLQCLTGIWLPMRHVADWTAHALQTVNGVIVNYDFVYVHFSFY